MSLFEMLLLAVALSIDAFVVSFSCGLTIHEKHKKSALKMAGASGFAQFIMPVIGWFGTNLVGDYVKSFDHWIVFFVFLVLGFKFIKDALSEDGDSKECKTYNGSIKLILIASFATSIDALAAGISLYFIPVSILVVSSLIGVVTFVNSYIAFRFSKAFRKVPTKYMEISAGVILITIGTKILIEHLLGYA